MLDRVPDSGSRTRDRQGPRSALPLTTIERIRADHAAGVHPAVLADEHRVSTRTVYRYLGMSSDPAHDLVLAVLVEARRTYGLTGLTRDRAADIATEVLRVLRRRRGNV